MFTPGTPLVGFGLYWRSPVVAVLIEAVVCAALVFWFDRAQAARGQALTAGRRRAMYAAFVGGSLLFIGNAHTSFRQLLGLS